MNLPTADDVARCAPYLQNDTFYVTNSDALRVAVASFSTSVVLVIRGRHLSTDGRLTPFEYRLVPTAARVVNSLDFPLADGWLLNVSVRLSATGPALGQVFARVDVVRGAGAAALELATIAQGPVGFSQVLTWPGSPIRTTLDAPGYLRVITGTDPAAGVEVVETVPTGARWELLSLAVTLVTDATVANRFPTIQLDNGVTAYASTGTAAAITASTTAGITAGDLGTALSATALGFSVPIPAGVVLSAAHRVRTQTTNLQAGDNYSAPTYLVRETLEAA